MEATAKADSKRGGVRAVRSMVTCCNCGNSGSVKDFETPQGTMECGDCSNTRQFRVEVLA